MEGFGFLVGKLIFDVIGAMLKVLHALETKRINTPFSLN